MDINNKKSLAVYPYIKEIGYSDPISSELLNKQFQSLKESVLRALIRTQEVNTSLSTYETAVNAQALTIGNYYKTLAYQEGDNAYITAHDQNYTYPNLYQDRAYGYLTMGLVSEYSKIPRNENYNGKVSPSVKVFINNIEQEFDSDPYRALDNSLKTVWFNKYDADSTVKFEIQLPPSLTKRFNYIQLDPFPIFGFNITDVQYQDFYGNYNSITEHMFGTDDPFLNNKGFPTKLYVSPKEFNGTIIIYGQTDSTGYFGFSNIDVGFQDFNNTTAEGYFKFKQFERNLNTTREITVNNIVLDYYFDAPNAKELLNGVNPVLEARLIVGTEVDGVVTPTNEGILLKLSSENTIALNTNITLQANQLLYLKLRFTEHNMTTPVFRGAKLNYTYR